MYRLFLSSAVLLLTLGFLISPAQAQSAWVKRCEGQGGAQTCEVVQRLMDQESKSRVLEVAIGFPSGKDAARFHAGGVLPATGRGVERRRDRRVHQRVGGRAHGGVVGEVDERCRREERPGRDRRAGAQAGERGFEGEGREVHRRLVPGGEGERSILPRGSV